MANGSASASVHDQVTQAMTALLKAVTGASDADAREAAEQLASEAEPGDSEDESDSTRRFDPRERRDPHGRWARGGGTAASSIASGITQARPEQFTAAFDKAFAGSPYAGFVNHYSLADIRAAHMTPLMSAGGKAGVLIHDHGDGRVEATALFNDSGKPGAGVGLLRAAIREHGVNYAECFGPVLPKLYGTLGFADDKVVPFDRAQAPPGWNEARFDQPGYHMMRLRRGQRSASRADAPGGLDTAREAAAAENPGWWETYGEQAWKAALAAFGVTPPGGEDT